MKISIVIRTYNEERYLGELLAEVVRQQIAPDELEIVLVDSGSTDSTLEIARSFGCRIVHIASGDFTFGRSLNYGCAAAVGNILVFVSGHCIPTSVNWLAELIRPLKEGAAAYSYGRQIGRDTTKFSEEQVFAKYFPPNSRHSQDGFFCNNANAAILRSTWSSIRFDEGLTGLEDLKMAKEIVSRGQKVSYVVDAVVFHIHSESWRQVRIRYEREAVALREIMPEIHVTFMNFLRYYLTGVINDLGAALRMRCVLRQAKGILLFRLMQFWGTYRGNLEHRQLSARRREEYFFPMKSRRSQGAAKPGSAVTAESP